MFARKAYCEVEWTLCSLPALLEEEHRLPALQLHLVEAASFTRLKMRKAPSIRKRTHIFVLLSIPRFLL